MPDPAKARLLPDRKAPRPFVVRICYECGQQQHNNWPQVCSHLSGCANIGRAFVPVELFAVVLSEYDALRFSLGLVQDHANDCGCGAYEVAQEALDNSDDYSAALSGASDEQEATP